MTHAPVFFFFLLFSVMMLHSSAQQIGNINYTVQQANATLQQTSAYVQTVNESGYLIFEPNLTAADNDLARAYGNYTSSPDLAVFYADRAYSEAQQQMSNINGYRSESLPIMAALTILFVLSLFLVTVPIKRRKIAERK